MALIELKNVSKDYGARRVLAGVNLAIEEGEFVSIVGVSASGKTTLLKLAAGLLEPTSGTVTIDGQCVSEFPRGAAIVFQNYSLLPWLNALANVELAVESAFPDWPACAGATRQCSISKKWGLRRRWRNVPASCPAACDSAWPSPGPSQSNPASSSSTSPLGAGRAYARHLAAGARRLVPGPDAPSHGFDDHQFRRRGRVAQRSHFRVGPGPRGRTKRSRAGPALRPRSAKALLQDEQAVKFARA